MSDALRHPRCSTRPERDGCREARRRSQALVSRCEADGVVMAARDAVREWNEPGSMWPDDWSRWQHAVDAVLPWTQRGEIADLA